MRITVRKQGKIVAQIEFDGETTVIGRDRENALLLPDPHVSRHHAKLYIQNHFIYVEDLKSRHGTFVNRQRITKTTILPGEKFQIGPFDLCVEPIPSTDHSLISQVEFLKESTSTYADLKEPEETLADSETNSKTIRDIEIKIKSSSIESIDDSTDAFQRAIAVNTVSSKKETSFSEQKQLPTNDAGQNNEDEDYDTTMPETSVSLPARLVEMDGERSGREIRLAKDSFQIGSDTQSDIVINDQKEDLSHISIRKEKETFILKDEAESTKTFVDGVPVRERELENHDIVQIGQSRFEFLTGDSKSIAEKPKVIERATAQPSPLVKKYASDWRLLILGGLLAGFLTTLLLPGGKQPSKKNQQKPAQSSTTQQTLPKTEESEQARLARFHMQQAKDLISQSKLEEAKNKLEFILQNIYPNHEDTLRLLQVVQTQQQENKRQIEVLQQMEKEKEHQIALLLAQGDQLVKEKKFPEAKKIYDKALSLDTTKTQSQSAIQKLTTLEEQNRRENVSKTRKASELKKIYTQGVKNFEQQNFSSAEKFLKEVVAAPESAYKDSAKKLLQEIEKQKKDNFFAQAKQAESLFLSNRLLEAYQKTLELKKKYPENTNVQRLLTKINKAMDGRAKELYTQGIMELKLAENLTEALDLFEAVLKYAPDPDNEYNQKAKKKISEIGLSP